MSAYSPITAAPETHEDRLAVGRAAFDAAGYVDGDGSWTRPAHRESFAHAYALIAAPLGQRLGVVERFVNDAIAAEQAHGAAEHDHARRIDAAIARAEKAGLTAPVRVGTAVAL